LKRTQGTPIFESQCISLFDLLLRFVVNQKDLLHYRQFCKKTPIDMEIYPNASSFLEGFYESKKPLLGSMYEEFLQLAINQLLKLRGQKEPNLDNCLDDLTDYFKSNGHFDESERDLAIGDLAVLKEHWMRYLRQISGGMSIESFRNMMAMGKTNPDVEEKGLALATVHTMKGLEYDIVFLMGMGEGTFPDYRALKQNSRELKEERNNAFVAITRAKRFIFISYPQQKIMPWGGHKYQYPSRFLKEMRLI
jgi:DNA helicase-2/ATP-dependent DNA helicase PcrA